MVAAPRPPVSPGARLAVVVWAAMALGAVEAVHAARYAAWEAAAVAGGLAALAALPLCATLALGVRLSLRGLVRVGLSHEPALVARWSWRMALAGLGLGGVAASAYVAAARAQVAFRFVDPAVAGLLVAGAVVAAALALALALGAVHALVGGAAQRRLQVVVSLGQRQGGVQLVAGALLVVGLWLAPVTLVEWVLPALDSPQVSAYAACAALGLWAGGTRLGESRIVRGLALVLVLALVVALPAALRSPGARRAALEHGALGKVALRLALAAGDRDGDGHAARWFGGADCDDSDSSRHPLVRERPGDGRDDNCNGAQAAAHGARGVAPPASPSTAQRPNLLLVSIDALRADHLGAWGYSRATSPHLDALAQRGVRFSWAMTSCPATRCAMPALMTGRYASTIDPRQPPETVATALRAAGWRTAAITCCDRFFDSVELAGFGEVDPAAHSARLARRGQSNADLVVAAAERWLERRDSAPFFLWLHLYDPHHPYWAPEEPLQFGERDVDRYDAELRYTDARLGELWRALERLGLGDSTIIAVTSDHGEEFGEHGLRFHSRSLYHQAVRIPLIWYVPPALGGSAPRVIDTPVSLVDVAPTLLELAHVASPPGQNGRSLAPALRGGEAPARPVLVELLPDRQIQRNLIALVGGTWKVIWDREVDAWSLFSLDDPADAHNLARKERARLLELQRRLAEQVDAELGEAPRSSLAP